MKSQSEIISNAYDYIVNTVICQKRLLSKDVLWGDGSIYGNSKEIFNAVYDAIDNGIKSNKLCVS